MRKIFAIGDIQGCSLELDQLIWLEGAGDHQGYFEIAFLPHVGTQRFLDYLHNGKTNIQFDIKENTCI